MNGRIVGNAYQLARDKANHCVAKYQAVLRMGLTWAGLRQTAALSVAWLQSRRFFAF